VADWGDGVSAMRASKNTQMSCQTSPCVGVHGSRCREDVKGDLHSSSQICTQFPPSSVTTVNFNYHRECRPDYAETGPTAWVEEMLLGERCVLQASAVVVSRHNVASICAHAMSSKWAFLRCADLAAESEINEGAVIDA